MVWVMIMNFNTLVNVSTFVINRIKEVLHIRKRIPQLYISTITLVADEQFNPESMFVDCMISNNSSERISVCAFELVRANGKAYGCALDDLGTIDGRALATALPLVIESSTTMRVIIEFNYSTEMIRWINRLKKKGDKLCYLRANTNRGDFGTCFITRFNSSMEDWYSGRNIAMKRQRNI